MGGENDNRQRNFRIWPRDQVGFENLTFLAESFIRLNLEAVYITL